MNEDRATRYQRARRRAHAADVACGAALLMLLSVTPAGRWLADWSMRASALVPAGLRGAVASAAFTGWAVVLWEVVAIAPLLYLGLSVDRRFKRVDQTVEGLIATQVRATLIGIVAATGAVAIQRTAVRVAGPLWWVVAGATGACLLVAAMQAFPALLIRAGRVRPIARRSLLGGLRELARRSNIPLADILEWQPEQGTTGTALVTGLGTARRVFIASDVMRDWTDDEIAVVVAHELAHHVHRDLWRTLALDAAMLSVGLWCADLVVNAMAPSLRLAGAGDLASLPLITLVTGGVWLAATPIRHAQSRSHETRADEFALKTTGEAEAFGAAIRRLSAQHLAEERPSPLARWLFHRHPSVSERLALAETFSKVSARVPISSLRR